MIINVTKLTLLDKIHVFCHFEYYIATIAPQFGHILLWLNLWSRKVFVYFEYINYNSYNYHVQTKMKRYSVRK